MDLRQWCNKHLGYISEEDIHYSNNYKMLTFCEKCFEELKNKDIKLTEGWRICQPERSKREDDYDECICNCHD